MSKKKAAKQKSIANDPPKDRLDKLRELYSRGRLNAAENLARSITNEFPKSKFGWRVLGAVLKQTGRAIESLAVIQKSLDFMPQDARVHIDLGNTLQELGRLEEALASYSQAIVLRPDLAEAHFNLGNSLYALGRFDEAKTSFSKVTTLKPDLAEAYFNLGNTLQELGRLEEAVASYSQAILLKPNLAEAHNNLGNVLKKQARFVEAKASYSQAIVLRPNFALAHSNLGNALQELGRLEEAVASYNQAIALSPNLAEAHSNLGVVLQELGRLEEAVASYSQATALKPDYAQAYVNLGIAVKKLLFNSSNPWLYTPLTHLLTSGNFVRPKDVAGSILSLIKHDTQIKHLPIGENFAFTLNETLSIIRGLDKLLLLHHLMRVCPLPELQFENFFVSLRRSLLKNLYELEVFEELVYFLSTLSIHCFTNEYVYFECVEEGHLVDELQADIFQTIEQSGQPDVIKILCLASYRPLHQYDWCQKLKSLDGLKEVRKRLIDEPLLEKKIAKDIPVLGEISDDVSNRVRKQYEENPYPRWVKLGISIKAKTIAAVCDELNLKLYSENIQDVFAPSLLIAGCGTGQQSIEAASRISNCQVTAVDLSLASLAYAQRKSSALSFTNIDYLQADILHLHKIGKLYDIIESAGVLHHMDEPMVGWRILVDLLKPGGLMKIGLYSELARRHIAEIREEIKKLGIGTSETEIRNFRQLLAESSNKNHQLLTDSTDFYSLSTLRDLIFHEQEHRFTIHKIKTCLDELGVKFCGFENEAALSDFRGLHGSGADIYDLNLWHQFEVRNPQAFAGMYQFWCQKP